MKDTNVPVGADILKLIWEDGNQVEAISRGANRGGSDDGRMVVVKVMVLNAHRHEVSDGKRLKATRNTVRHSRNRRINHSIKSST